MNNLIKIIEEVENKPTHSLVDSAFPSLQEEEELKRVKNIIFSRLAFIEEEIEHLFFGVIKNCKNIEEAKKYFDVLQKIQEIVGGLFFKDQIEISNIMENFIRKCDRLDDPWLRQYIFDQIKCESYSLET